MKKSALPMRRLLPALFLCVFSGIPGAVSGDDGDWPVWRFDSAHTASTPHNLPDELHPLWVRQYSPRKPAWDDPLNRDLMPFDRIFEPIVADGTLVVGFNDSDKIVALDTDTGKEKWTFYTDGPVRLPPAAWNGKVYATSDDGFLYCLDLRRGSLVWKFRGGPSDRRVLGNGRLVSMWPARGGVAIEDGVVYFAASIWPFMGIFIYALDAETGGIVWVNDGEGSRFMRQPHNAPSFAGVAPQGSMTVSGDRLLISGGRSVPACFDRHTGEFLYYELAASGKTGGSFVAASGPYFFNHYRERVTSLFHGPSGNMLAPGIGKYPVLDGGAWYFSGETVAGFDAAAFDAGFNAWLTGAGEVDKSDLLKQASALVRENRRWEIDVNATGDLIRAGKRLYAAGDGVITAIDLDAGGNMRMAGNSTAFGKGASGGAAPAVAWTKTVQGEVERLIAADGKLFAVTLDGRIMAFGGKRRTPRRILDRPVAAGQTADVVRRARAILGRTGVTEGYALVYGVDDGSLLEALLTHSGLHIVAIDPDGKPVEKARRHLDGKGLYGSRAAVHQGEPFGFSLPPYLFSLTVVNGDALPRNGLDESQLESLFSSMRPYGGKAWLPIEGDRARRFASLVRESGLKGARTEVGEGCVLLSREGALPGSAPWTHNLGDIGNTAKSDDERVKLPLGLLWFGGNSNMDVLPRHAHGPAEQVVDGRLFIEGDTSLSARDVYTGRVIWKRMLHDLGNYNVYFDHTYKDTPTSTRYNQVHIPGANIRGTNFVATSDRVYVLQGAECHALDARTGETRDVFRLPPVDPDADRPVSPPWGYIGVYDDLLIGGYGFVAFSDLLDITRAEYAAWKDFDLSASAGIVVMDRMTGEVKWKRDARYGFLHNGIAAGDGVLYCLDKLPPLIENRLSRRGEDVPGDYRLIALDLRTGEPRWEDTANAFGSFLSYSKEHRLLLQSTRPSRDTVGGEDGKRIVVFRADSGDVLWDKAINYRTFPILHGGRIVTESGIFSLLDGETVHRANPLTGGNIPWTWKRMYGCNFPMASEHLLTFRSGAAGFYDFTNAGGTGNFGGFKSGCTNSIVAADGVLNIPDYTRTCSCAYQNQASLAMVYMPDADIEVWTYDTVTWDGEPIERVGINLGAPGDRLSDDGTLWLDYPVVGGDSPDIPVTVTPEGTSWYRRHSSRIAGDGPAWVAASGCDGVGQVTVTLAKEASPPRLYTVRLHFAEPVKAKAGERVFGVSVQGRTVLKGFDIAAETGGRLISTVKEFRGVSIGAELAVRFDPAPSSKRKPVLSGIEVIAEKKTAAR